MFRLLAGWLTLFVVGTDLFVVSPLLPSLAGDFHISPESAGLTVTLFSLGYVIAAPLFGRLADHAGRGLVLTSCLVAFALANLLTSEAGNLPAMLVARGLCGIAAAGVTPSVYALVGATAPPGRRATWVAIVLTGLLSSLSLGAPLGAMTAHQVGWPVVFQVLAAGGLVLALLNHFAWRRIALAAARHGAVGPGRLNAAALGRDLAPTVAWSAALYSLYTYLSAGLIALDYTATQIAGLLIVYGAAAFAGTLLGGRLADRWGPGFSTRASLLGVATCYLLLRFALVWRAEYCAAAALGLTSLVAQTFFPARQSLLMSRFPARISTALAWNNSALFLGMTLGSLIGGHAMAIGGLPAVLTGSIALAITGWAGCLPHPAPADVPETI